MHFSAFVYFHYSPILLSLHCILFSVMFIKQHRQRFFSTSFALTVSSAWKVWLQNICKTGIYLEVTHPVKSFVDMHAKSLSRVWLFVTLWTVAHQVPLSMGFSRQEYWKERKKEREVAQSCPTLCNPMDCSPPGSSIHGIFQARVLGWVAISFSRESSQPRDWTCVSYISCIGRRVLYH